MMFIVEFPPDTCRPPFNFDFGLFPRERPELPPREQPVAAASSASASHHPQQPAPGPSSRPYIEESSAPVITFEDYQVDSDSDNVNPHHLVPPTTPPPEEPVQGGKGKGRETDPFNAESSASAARQDAIPTCSPTTPPHPSPPPALPPTLHPSPSPASTPQSSPSASRHFAARRRGGSRHPTRRRPARQSVPSDIADPSYPTNLPHPPTQEHQTRLERIVRSLVQALAVVPRTMESL